MIFSQSNIGRGDSHLSHFLNFAEVEDILIKLQINLLYLRPAAIAVISSSSVDRIESCTFHRDSSRSYRSDRGRFPPEDVYGEFLH